VCGGAVMSGAGVHRVIVSGSVPLVIRYSGTTSGGRGARLIVRDDTNARRVFVPYRYDLGSDDRVRDAVETWLRVHGERYSGASWVIGSVSGDQWVAVPLFGCRVVEL
jgi:hypothetical protein